MAEPTRPILIVCLARGFGGAEVRVLDLASALHGLRPYAVVTLDQAPLFRRLVARGLHAVAIGRSRADARLLWRLVRLIRRIGPGVVDAHNPQSQFWALAAARLAGVPVTISTVHSIYAETQGGWWKPHLYVGVLRLNARWRCRFVAVSQGIRRSLEALGIGRDRIVYSPNALAAGWGSVPGDAGLRFSLGWQAETVVAVIGRLIPEKGHLFLLQALRELRSRYPRLRCIVVGEGPERARLEQKVAVLGLDDIVRLVGFREDVAAVLAETDIVCMPSLTEGLPYTALEAAALARPLVLSAVGELPDHFEDGHSARLIRPGCVPDLVEALAWCIDHPREALRMGERARAAMHRRLSPQRMLAETLAVYDGHICQRDTPQVAHQQLPGG